MKRLSCGIVGLPNVGKSTLFNALTSKQAEASNYPFCTIDPNVGVVFVPDPRLAVLSKISGSSKITYAYMDFVDIAGLVAGASKGEGLGNKFLAHIRETDAIVQVVRCFDSEDIIHVAGRVSPIDDMEVIALELELSDLQTVENSIAKLEKQAKGNKEVLPNLEILKKVKEHLDSGNPVRTLSLSAEEKSLLQPYPLLTNKRILYVANVDDASLPSMENEYVRQVRARAEKEGNMVIPVCAQLEAEIAELPEDERQAFLESMGLEQSGLDRLIKVSFSMLGLISFLTTGEMETRAWTIHQGTNAVNAAGEIHTDIQEGFVRAEVVSYEDFVACGGRAKARETGKLRAEGRDYIMKDGDVVLFLHH
jgi:GTP-binding protein YchF